MAILTVRVGEVLRRKMRRLKHVNWSEVVRRAIEERVAFEASIRGKRARVLEASKNIDEIFEDVRRRYGSVRYDSAETVRVWREARYGVSSRTPR